jgi:hypothetical protein
MKIDKILREDIILIRKEKDYEKEIGYWLESNNTRLYLMIDDLMIGFAEMFFNFSDKISLEKSKKTDLYKIKDSIKFLKELKKKIK